MTNKYIDEQRVEIADKEYDSYKVGDPLKLKENGMNIGYVSQVNDDFETGEQSYVITNQKADKAQSDPNSVKYGY